MPSKFGRSPNSKRTLVAIQFVEPESELLSWLSVPESDLDEVRDGRVHTNHLRLAVRFYDF